MIKPPKPVKAVRAMKLLKATRPEAEAAIPPTSNFKALQAVSLKARQKPMTPSKAATPIKPPTTPKAAENHHQPAMYSEFANEKYTSNDFTSATYSTLEKFPNGDVATECSEEAVKLVASRNAPFRYEEVVKSVGRSPFKAFDSVDDAPRAEEHFPNEDPVKGSEHPDRPFEYVASLKGRKSPREKGTRRFFATPRPKRSATETSFRVTPCHCRRDARRRDAAVGTASRMRSNATQTEPLADAAPTPSSHRWNDAADGRFFPCYVPDAAYSPFRTASPHDLWMPPDGAVGTRAPFWSPGSPYPGYGMPFSMPMPLPMCMPMPVPVPCPCDTCEGKKHVDTAQGGDADAGDGSTVAAARKRLELLLSGLTPRGKTLHPERLSSLLRDIAPDVIKNVLGEEEGEERRATVPQGALDEQPRVEKALEGTGEALERPAAQQDALDEQSREEKAMERITVAPQGDLDEQPHVEKPLEGTGETLERAQETQTEEQHGVMEEQQITEKCSSSGKEKTHNEEVTNKDTIDKERVKEAEKAVEIAQEKCFENIKITREKEVDELKASKTEYSDKENDVKENGDTSRVVKDGERVTVKDKETMTTLSDEVCAKPPEKDQQETNDELKKEGDKIKEKVEEKKEDKEILLTTHRPVLFRPTAEPTVHIRIRTRPLFRSQAVREQTGETCATTCRDDVQDVSTSTEASTTPPSSGSNPSPLESIAEDKSHAALPESSADTERTQSPPKQESQAATQAVSEGECTERSIESEKSETVEPPLPVASQVRMERRYPISPCQGVTLTPWLPLDRPSPGPRLPPTPRPASESRPVTVSPLRPLPRPPVRRPPAPPPPASRRFTRAADTPSAGSARGGLLRPPRARAPRLGTLPSPARGAAEACAWARLSFTERTAIAKALVDSAGCTVRVGDATVLLPRSGLSSLVAIAEGLLQRPSKSPSRSPTRSVARSPARSPTRSPPRSPLRSPLLKKCSVPEAKGGTEARKSRVWESKATSAHNVEARGSTQWGKKDSLQSLEGRKPSARDKKSASAAQKVEARHSGVCRRASKDTTGHNCALETRPWKQPSAEKRVPLEGRGSGRRLSKEVEEAVREATMQRTKRTLLLERSPPLKREPLKSRPAPNVTTRALQGLEEHRSAERGVRRQIPRAGRYCSMRTQGPRPLSPPPLLPPPRAFRSRGPRLQYPAAPPAAPAIAPTIAPPPPLPFATLKKLFNSEVSLGPDPSSVPLAVPLRTEGHAAKSKSHNETPLRAPPAALCKSKSVDAEPSGDGTLLQAAARKKSSVATHRSLEGGLEGDVESGLEGDLESGLEGGLFLLRRLERRCKSLALLSLLSGFHEAPRATPRCVSSPTVHPTAMALVPSGGVLAPRATARRLGPTCSAPPAPAPAPTTPLARMRASADDLFTVHATRHAERTGRPRLPVTAVAAAGQRAGRSRSQAAARRGGGGGRGSVGGGGGGGGGGGCGVRARSSSLASPLRTPPTPWRDD